MSEEKKYYCFCGSNCKYETMTKEQILAAIAQAVETGSVGDCDAGFITKLKEMNGGGCVTLWVGTRAQYNAIAEKAANCIYIITDDTTTDDLLHTVENMAADAEQSAQLAERAAQVASDLQAVDISDKLSATLTSVGDPDNIMINDIQATYSPALGIVFYQYSFLSGVRLTAGSTVRFSLSGGYGRSKTTAGALICYAKKGALGGYIAGSGNNTSIYVDIYEEISGTTLAGFSGWYFCDGE